MEEPRTPEPPEAPPAAEQQITYVGGLGEAPRGRAWPFIALGLIPALLALAVLVFWSPIRSLGRGAGKTIAPYSLALIDLSWSSDDLIATVPYDLVVKIQNTDQRAINGLTVHFTRLDPAWEIIGASSPNAHGSIDGNAVFFPNQIRPNGTLRMSITMRASAATDSDIAMSLAAGHDAGTARVDLLDGRTASLFSFSGKARTPTEDDAYARFTAIYEPLATKGNETNWRFHVTNTGPITITQIRLAFPPSMNADFDILYLPSQASELPDGSLQYALSLPPGGQTVLETAVVPHVTGHFQFPIKVYLEKAGVPLAAPDGGPPITLDLTVK